MNYPGPIVGRGVMLAAMLPPGGRGPYGSSRSGVATLWNHSNPGHSTLSRMGS